MRRRRGDTDEELEGEAEEVAPPAGDLGSMLMGVQESSGNAALAGLIAQVESGEVPATALLPGQDAGESEELLSERERRGAADRATHAVLQQRLFAAKASPFARRIEGELTAFERRLRDAREYGWVGTDAAVLSSELETLEDKLRRAEAEEQAVMALAAVDFRRRPLSERTKKAVMERTAITKPGMLLYAPEDFEALAGIHDELTELQKRLIDNGIAVTTSRASLGNLSAVATAYAQGAAATLAEDVEKAGTIITELELRLQEITDRHSRANAEDRERLNQLIVGLEPKLRREPHLAMASGSSKQEIDYLIKKAWLEQHELTQRLAKDEVWQLVTGFSPAEGRVCYIDLPERMGQWRIHLTLDYGVMKAVDVECSDSDIRDALMGGAAGVVMRSHATAEVLSRNDDRNPHYYYGTSKVTPRREFWETREGKAAKRNWRHYEGELKDAFDTKADELVQIVHEVLEQRKELKSVVVKVGESLTWAD